MAMSDEQFFAAFREAFPVIDTGQRWAFRCECSKEEIAAWRVLVKAGTATEAKVNGYWTFETVL